MDGDVDAVVEELLFEGASEETGRAEVGQGGVRVFVTGGADDAESDIQVGVGGKEGGADDAGLAEGQVTAAGAKGESGACHGFAGRCKETGRCATIQINRCGR